MFNQGFWRKDHALWEDVQSADWKDVILKDGTWPARLPSALTNTFSAEFKTNLKKDVYGFFKSEPIYKELAIPWKVPSAFNARSLPSAHTHSSAASSCGDPLYALSLRHNSRLIFMQGNGKTISIKVIMKTCDALGFAPLYVKSFQSKPRRFTCAAPAKVHCQATRVRRAQCWMFSRRRVSSRRA